MQSLDLPEPSEIEKQHSQKLLDVIAQEINQSGGWIDFAHYMRLALYAPSLGYYSGGLQKFGEQGDFITSPEVSPLFAQTLANPMAKLLAELPNAQLMEFGAGSGKLAADLLYALNNLGQLPETYFIVELSADLQQRQREILLQRVPDLLPRVQWLNQLPEKSLNVIIIANEVMDAMPVTRFAIKDDKVMQQGVVMQDGELALSYRPASDEIQQQVEALEIPTTPGFEYCSELNLNIAPWIKSLAECINQGAIYLIDYGYTRSEFYSDERDMGTFIGYYHHRALDAPLWYPGLQDLTAFVDFTAVAEAALENELDVDGFTSQGNFLINCGLAELVDNIEATSEVDNFKLVQQMKTLSLPGEMGERFKVLGLSKGLKENVPGFEVRDLRYSL